MGCADSKDKATAPTLKAGEQLNKGQSIVSANGRFKFILQEDGNAVVYRGERALWGSNTHGKTVTHLTLAADGVLFIKNAEENVWSTETAGSAADQLTIKDDGNLVLLDKDGNTKWESKSTFDDGQFDLRTKSAVVAAKAPIGVTVEAGKTYYWCTCGKSKNQPFCDGSHADTEFKPLAWTAPESKEVYFCVCKKTDNAPFCDGAHSKIEDAPPAAAAAAAPSPADESQYDLRTKSAVVADRKPIGVAVEAGKTYYWCTCGKSKNQPWCDGSHQGTEFKPLAWTAPETKEVYLCLCKQTKNAPFCDGAHTKIEAAPAAAAVVAAPPPVADESQYDLRSKSAVIADRKPIGVKVEAGKTYYWCTCGKSKNQPWCDGSHQGSEFKPLAWTAPESKEVYICLCKKTKNAPFCDGAHTKIEAAPAAAAVVAAPPPAADESQYDLRTKSATVALRRPLKIAVEAGKTYYWCTCGKSKNQPWCDGSHQGTDFKPLAWTAPESKDVFICACKQTKNAPFCDGAHRALPPTDTLNRSTTDYLIPGGAGITSKNGKFRVVLQTDGNVVLYEGPENLSEHAKWATGTDGKEGAKFIVQADGNVVLYNKADQPLWASNTDGSAATRLVVTDDGKLVLFGEGDQHLWSS